ncbi:MAG: biopolymer transporter ExbD [Myxococcota bacterium]|nr:biopolymer transporter ExbD [Myxococcota bacterium]
MARSHRQESNVAQTMNLTPLIDMVFILLIFFIVTSSFVKETGIDVERPSALSAERKEAATILVAVTADGKIWVNERPVDLRRLRAAVERLRVESPEAAAVVVADTNARMGLAVEVIDQVRLAGVTRVSVAASLEGEP